MTNILLIILIGLNFALFIILSLIYNILKFKEQNEYQKHLEMIKGYKELKKRDDNDE